MARKIVVVGGGAAGMGAAGGVKAVDPGCEVTVYTGFDDVAYSPCGIPYVHGKEIDSFERLFLASKQAYVDAGIDVHYNADVTEVDVSRKVVDGRGQGEVSWDTLVLATGFDYADPGVPGGDLGGLYYVKNIREAMEWDKVLDTVKSAVVVEASPLGVEMVTALAHRGIETHLVDPNPWPLAEMADPDIMAPVEESWRELGVTTHFNTTLKAFLGDGQVRAVQTSDGEIAADLVVVCTHKEPNNALGVAAGLKIGSTGGIIVDERMATSAPGVYAAGDCAEIPHGLTGVPLQGLTGSHAYAQGKTAGINAAVARAPTTPSTCRGAPRRASGSSAARPSARPPRPRWASRTSWGGAGHLPGPLLPGREAGQGQAARRAGQPAAHRRADGRRRGHQGARRLPGDGGQVRPDPARPGQHGERLLAGDRRAQRADRRGRPEGVDAARKS